MTTARPRRVLPALLIALSVFWGPNALGGLPKVPDDFEVRVVLSVPSVLYPCQLATRPDGALFVAVDPMDQVGPYESNLGKIFLHKEGQEPVLFAEGFRAIFGMAWHDNALYVSHMPYLSVIRDTDGDGKADSRQDLFKDLGITNNKGLNDHIVSGIQFGIDNKLYISTGDKGVLKATGPDGKTAQVVGGGTLRCKADGTEIEVVSTGTRNHLEPNLDEKDNLFTYDNTDDGDGWWTRVTHHVDGGYYGYPYDYHKHPERFINRIAEFGGGSPCGGVVYKEDAWPAKYHNRVIWSEWGKRRVSAFAFEPSGASFKVKDVVELAEVGEAGEFRPLDVALSYDGKTLYVADWGMGSWGSKTEKVGRVYAITPKVLTPSPRPRGTDNDPIDAQIKQLDHPSWNERMRAQLALIKKGKDALPAVVAALADPKADPVALRHLVWTVDGIAGGTPEGDSALISALKSPVADARAQAARALGERRAKAAESPLIALLKDGEPSVRLQAIVALGRVGLSEAVPSLLPILTDPDRYLAFSSRVAIRRIGDWTAVASGLNSADPKLRGSILAALELVYSEGAVDLLKRVAGDSKAVEGERAKALDELALVYRKAPPWDGKWWGTRPTQGKPPAKTIDWEASPTILATIEASLSDPSAPIRLAAVSAARETGEKSTWPKLRDRFGVERDPGVREAIALALGAMGDKDALPLLVAALRDVNNTEAVRSAALSGLESIGGKPATGALVEALANPNGGFNDDAQARMIAALGRFKAREAVPAIVARLGHASPALRSASAEALGKIGDKQVAPQLRSTLKDESVDVRKAALASLAELKDRDAIPTMIDLANAEPTRFEATLALAKVPDIRALQVYLRGVGDRSQDVRKASSAALVAIRDKAEPVLEQLGARREIPTSALPELRKIYNELMPVAGWHVMGPFPFGDRPPTPQGKPVDLAATAEGPEGAALKWEPVAIEGEHGKVDLAKLYHGKGDCSAFAAAELESPTARPARMSVGSDDTLNVWLNGKEVYKFGGNRSYEPDTAQFDVELRKGKNLLYVKCGNGGGPWEFSVAVTGTNDYAFLKGPATGGFDPDRFKAFAMRGQGKPEKGKALFSDLKGLACAKCHVVNNEGGNIGPNLSGVGALYPREELIQSVLYPSARIFSGYEAVVVATSDGRVLTGLIKSDDAEGVEIQDAEGKRTKVPKADVEERKVSELSLMPNGIVEGISQQDFADLIAYLETLKDASANQGKK